MSGKQLWDVEMVLVMALNDLQEAEHRWLPAPMRKELSESKGGALIIFSLEYPGYIHAQRGGDDYYVCCTPEHEGDKGLSIQVMKNDGEFLLGETFDEGLQRAEWFRPRRVLDNVRAIYARLDARQDAQKQDGV